MDTVEHDIYLKIFHHYGMAIDEDIENYLYDWNYENEIKKSKFLGNILKNNSLMDVDFVRKIKSILPNGLNKVGSCSNEEFENLKKEFQEFFHYEKQ